VLLLGYEAYICVRVCVYVSEKIDVYIFSVEIQEITPTGCYISRRHPNPEGSSPDFQKHSLGWLPVLFWTS
jgi:hypothetical protein